MGPIVAVDDIALSRFFYEKQLAQTVKYDFGVNVTFEGDFSIHLRSHLRDLLGDDNLRPITRRTHEGELTFETDEIDSVQQRLESGAVEFIHPMREQPWGQRVLRVYDPDGHVIEIGEAMEMVVRRLQGQGLLLGQICEKTGMPESFVAQAMVSHDTGASQRTCD
jgi:hypothetical protein